MYPTVSLGLQLEFEYCVTELERSWIFARA
jgi:hypothetical protein